jgi:hypothetical protein
VPKALDALADELDNRDNPNRLKAAVEVLKLAQLPSGAAGIGSTDAEEIVRGIVLTRRGRARGPLDDLVEINKGLPTFEKHMRDTWDELEGLANEVETARESSGESEGRSEPVSGRCRVDRSPCRRRLPKQNKPKIKGVAINLRQI